MKRTLISRNDERWLERILVTQRCSMKTNLHIVLFRAGSAVGAIGIRIASAMTQHGTCVMGVDKGTHHSLWLVEAMVMPP